MDKHAAALRAMARDVNLVWNCCNRLSAKVFERERRFIGKNELHEYLAGASKEGLGVGSVVFQQVIEELVRRRRQFKRVKLRWRVSRGARRSLGCITFKARSLAYKGGQVSFQGPKMSLWASHGLSAYKLGAGNISEDARGRWYLNVSVKVANRRKDQLQKLSTELVRLYLATFVGNVNSGALAQTRMAKSVLDAGWSAFRAMLQYKCDDAGLRFKEVDQRYSTQDCSTCGTRAGPAGRQGLAVQGWRCPCCGKQHDRDVNAAVNIRNRRLAWLEQQFSVSAGPRGCEPEPNEAAYAAGAGHGPLVEEIPVL